MWNALRDRSIHNLYDARSLTSLFTGQREREKEGGREREREREGEKEGERERERRMAPVKGMTGALGPFGYLVLNKFVIKTHVSF
jgi:hypothetical protein